MDASALEALKAQAALVCPQALQQHPDRVLLVDGDGLAYACAGNDNTSPGEAKEKLRRKIAEAQAKSGAARVIILVTGRGSHKGHRYAIARVKPYQGQRSSSRRPKNWAFLRELLETGALPYETEITPTLEADDLFGKYTAALGPENVVVYTEDKDMQRQAGWHLSWRDLDLLWVPPGTYCIEHLGKVYGDKWFWLQMLQGDAADWVPGLPKYVSGHDKKGEPKLSLCGPATAEKLLAGCTNNQEAAERVFEEYHALYQERAHVEFLEQAILLWMRDADQGVFSCLKALGATMPEYAINEIKMRVAAWECA